MSVTREQVTTPTGIKPKVPLWAHQSEAVRRAEVLPHFALFFDPGTGKTATTINILRAKYARHKKLFPTLILCPPVVVENWKREFLVHSNVPADRIVLLQGAGRKRLFTLLSANPESIFITNYEALLMPDLFDQFLKILNAPQSALVLDEGHKCKEVSSKRTKLAIRLADLARYRYLLTGTPILNRVMDIFAQFRILDRGETFGSNFFSFRARYFYDKNRHMPKDRHFPDWQLLPNSEEEIKAKIQSISMLAKKEDCIDLPPLVRQRVEVELGPEQKRLYKSMKEDLIATLSDEKGKLRASIADLAITKALRLQQIASGHIKVESEDGPTETIQIKENPRRDALKEILAEIAPHHKVIVWSVFKDNYRDIREICEELKLDFVEVHGETKDKQSAVDEFNNSPSVRVLIGHPRSGGIGINLVSASYSVFYTRSFSLEDDVQAEARNYRAGSTVHQKVTRIDLVAKGTIDEIVLKALSDKMELSARILVENMEEL